MIIKPLANQTLEKSILDHTWIEWIFYCMVFTIPLIVYLKIIPVPAQYMGYWINSNVFDFFSYYKAKTLIALSTPLFIALLYLAFLKFNRKNALLYLKGDTLIWFFILYGAFILISTAFSDYLDIALNGFFERSEGIWVLLAYLAVFLTLYLKKPSYQFFYKLIFFLALSAFIISLIGFFQFLGKDFFNSSFGKAFILPSQYEFLTDKLTFPLTNFYSTLYNGNNLSHFMATLLPVFVVLFTLSKSKASWLFLLIGISCYIGLIVSNGRGGWMAAVSVITFLALIVLVKKDRYQIKKIIFMALLFTTIFGAMNMTSNGEILKRAESTFIIKSANKNDFYSNYRHLFSGRVGMWLNSLPLSKKTIIIGHGPDTFAFYYPNDPSQPKGKRAFIDKPHNIYIQNLINIGGLGLISFLGVMVVFFYRSYRYLVIRGIDDEGGVLVLALSLGVLGYLLAGMFYDSTLHVSPIFWIILGLGASLTKAQFSKKQPLN